MRLRFGDGDLRQHATATGQETAQWRKSPATDLKTLQAKAVGAQQDVETLLFETQRHTDLALEAADCPALGQRLLKGVELSADAIDQFAGAAEIDRALAAFFSVAEAIVGAEGFAVATAPTGGDVALAGEEARAQGEQSQRGVVELVSKLLDFQF